MASTAQETAKRPVERQPEVPQGMQGAWGALEISREHERSVSVTSEVSKDKAFDAVKDHLDSLKNVNVADHPIVEGILANMLPRDKDIDPEEFRDQAKIIAAAVIDHCQQIDSPEKLKKFIENIPPDRAKFFGDIGGLASLSNAQHVDASEFSKTFNEVLGKVAGQFVHTNLVDAGSAKRAGTEAPLAYGQSRDGQAELIAALEKFSDTASTVVEKNKTHGFVRTGVERITSGLAGVSPSKLPGQETEISINGDTTLTFQQTEKGTVVTIALSPANITATFEPPVIKDGLDPAVAAKKLQAYEEVCAMLQGRSPGNEPSLPLDIVKYPDLTSNNSPRNIRAAYRALFINSGANVSFSAEEDKSSSYLTQKLETLMKNDYKSGLIIESTVQDRDELVQELNEEVKTLTASKQLAALNNGETIRITRDVMSTGEEAIQEVTIRREQGEIFVDLTTNGLKPSDASAVISFRLESDESGSLERLAKVLNDFEMEDKGDVSTSETVKGMLEIGELSGVVSSDPGKKVILDNVNWLGETLAPNAKFQNVEFRNSSLDFTGSGAKFEKCVFRDCRVAMRLEKANFTNSMFDSKSTLSGSISGVFNKTGMYGNAYNLDWRNVDVQGLGMLKGVTWYFTRCTVNKHTMPAAFHGKTRDLSKRETNLMFDRLDSQFNGDSVRALIHQYSNENLKDHNPLANIVTKGGLVRQFGMEDDKKGGNGENRVIPTIRNKNPDDDFEIIDVFPRDVKRVDGGHGSLDPNTRMLRMFIDKNNNVWYAAGKLSDITKIDTPTHDGLSGGNAKAFQATLDFVHLGKEPDTGASNAVFVDGQGAIDKEPDDSPVDSGEAPEAEDPTVVVSSDVDPGTVVPTPTRKADDLDDGSSPDESEASVHPGVVTPTVSEDDDSIVLDEDAAPKPTKKEEDDDEAKD